MISFTSGVVSIARGRRTWSVTAAQESRIVATLIAVFLACALAVILHAMRVATAW